jgi:hypothetical protein
MDMIYLVIGGLHLLVTVLWIGAMIILLFEIILGTREVLVVVPFFKKLIKSTLLIRS